MKSAVTKTAKLKSWRDKRTSETRAVEALLRRHFQQVHAYRYNSASIRVRVVDPCFKGMTFYKRAVMMEQYLNMLPPETQADIIKLFPLTPAEAKRKPTVFEDTHSLWGAIQ